MTQPTPTPPASNPGARAQFRVFAAVLGTTVFGTVQFMAPGLPEFLVLSWLGVYTAGTGLLEAGYDSWRGRQSRANEGLP